VTRKATHGDMSGSEGSPVPRTVAVRFILAAALTTAGCPFGSAIATTVVYSSSFEIKATLKDLWAGTGSGAPSAATKAKVPLLPDLAGSAATTYVKFPAAAGDDGMAVPLPAEVKGRRSPGGTIEYTLTNELPVPATVQLFFASAKAFDATEGPTTNLVVRTDRVLAPGVKDEQTTQTLSFAFVSRLQETRKGYRVLAALPNPTLDAREVRLGLGLATPGSRGAEVDVDPAALVVVTGRVAWIVEQ